MGNYNQNSGTDKELDMIDVIGKVGNFVWLLGGKLGRGTTKLAVWIGRLLRFFVRKTLWFVVFAAVAVVINKFKSSETNYSYETTTLFKMNLLNNAVVKDYVNSLTNLPAGDSAWKNTLLLPDYKTAKQIVSIKACWGIDYNYDSVVDLVDVKNNYNKPREWDTIMAPSMVMSDRFYVVSVVNNKSVIPLIRKGLEERIRSNPYFVAQANVQRSIVAERIRHIAHQMVLLDSLQTKEYTSLSNSSGVAKLWMNSQGQILSFHERDQKLLHPEALKLLNMRMALELQLALPEIEIISGDTGELVSSYTRFSLGLSLLLALIASLIWDYRKWMVTQILHPFTTLTK